MPDQYEPPMTLVEGVGHPQGPDVLADGSIIYAETYLSRLMACDRQGHVRLLFDCGGGPNAVLAGDDGRIYFTQNGGQAGEWRADRQRPPAIEVFDPASGTSTTLCGAVGDRPLLAPHDMTWGPDGHLYVTDSGTWAPGGATEPGMIVALAPSGEARLIADTGHVFPSGIALAADGTLYWAECYTRRIMVMRPGQPAQTLCILPEEHTPESIAIDAQGRLWVAALEQGGFDILDQRGTIVGFVRTGGYPLNAVLDGGFLFVTDLGDYDESLPDPQIVGRIQSVEVGVGPAPRFRSRIASQG